MFHDFVKGSTGMLFYDILKDISEAKSRLAKSTQSKEKINRQTETERERGGRNEERRSRIPINHWALGRSTYA